MSDTFEGRLARALQGYADERTRPVDALAVATAVAGTRADGRPIGRRATGVRVGLLLAAALGTSILAALLLGTGGTHRPIVEASTSPAASPAATLVLSLPAPYGWMLEWERSGLAAPLLSGVPGERMFSTLTFAGSQVQLAQGFGGGCESVRGTFSLAGNNLGIALPDGASDCGPGSPTVVRQRLQRTASFSIARETCQFVFNGTASSSPTACRTLSLFDSSGNVLLVYQAPANADATPDPGTVAAVTQLSASRWLLDWTATGLDGYVISTIGQPMDSILTFAPPQTFTFAQGYGGMCPFDGSVRAGQASIVFIFDPGFYVCKPVSTLPVPQVVLGRLARVQSFSLGTADCSAAVPAATVGDCETLTLRDAFGATSLVYHPIP